MSNANLISRKQYSHTLKNGLTIVAEEIPHAESAAATLLVPIGSTCDPEGYAGITNMMVDMFSRGAGQWNSQELSAEFENLGIEHSESSGMELAVFSGALLSENLAKLFSLMATMILEPHFDSAELENAKALALQELLSLEDEPSSKVMVRLNEKFYPAPYGRLSRGTEAGIKAITSEALKTHHRKMFSPHGAVLGVSGKFDFPAVCAAIEKAFSAWTGDKQVINAPALATNSQVFHLPKDTNQLQIAFASPSVKANDPEYYAARVGVGILSGGMHGRLFIEVREKRGLVYRVSANHSSTSKHAGIFAYAGTTNKHAEETFAVMLKEMRGLSTNITEDEVKRSKADLKSRLVMQSDLSSARASQLAHDWWILGRLRTVTEVASEIDKVNLQMVMNYASHYPVSPITLVTLGSVELSLPN
ncbi:insulinase family protein [bacterium]|nr:insulinase family protein [bacterium]